MPVRCGTERLQSLRTLHNPVRASATGTSGAGSCARVRRSGLHQLHELRTSLPEPVGCLGLADARHLRAALREFQRQRREIPVGTGDDDVPHTLQQTASRASSASMMSAPFLPGPQSTIRNVPCCRQPATFRRRAINPADAPRAEAFGLGHDRSGTGRAIGSRRPRTRPRLPIAVPRCGKSCFIPVLCPENSALSWRHPATRLERCS
jgi:hypothetical protein